MTIQNQIFRRELAAIQMRHPTVFTKDQLPSIKMVQAETGYLLELEEGLILPDVVLMEIEFAFKLSLLA